MFHIIAGIIASYIAWKRNSKSEIFFRVAISVLAFILGILYILYYIVFVQFLNIFSENKDDLKDLMADSLRAF
jgi:CHASE2 domain-containing sensor protein